MRAAFAADLPRRRAELRAAVEGGDMEAAAGVLHGLRGSAAHLGAGELAALCAALEAAADRGACGRHRAPRCRAWTPCSTRFERLPA